LHKHQHLANAVTPIIISPNITIQFTLFNCCTNLL
jgi:hypothetical protein